MTKPSSTNVPAIPMELSRLEGPRGFLARAAPADGKLFSLTGRRGTVWGSGLRGVEEIRVGAWKVHGLVTGLGPASNVLVDPSGVRRELTDTGGTALESLLLAQRIPAAVLQWSRPPGSSEALDLELSWLLTCDLAGEITGDPEPDHLSVSVRPQSGGSSQTALVFARPAPDGWEVRREGDALHVRVRLRAAPDGSLSVVFAAGAAPTERSATLRVVSAPRTEEVRAEQALATSRQEQLALHTGVVDLDEGLEWAKARVRGAVVAEAGGRGVRRGGGPCAPAAHAHPAPPSPFSLEAEPCWVGLGALAAGDPEPAEVVLEGEYDTTYHLLLAARYVAWTGSAGPLHEHIDRLDQAIARAAAQGTLGGAAGFTLRELADAWESVGEKGRAASLRKLVGSPAEMRASGRRLPMLAGASAASREEEELALALLSPDASSFHRAPSSAPDRAVDRALRAWASCRSGDPDIGYTLLRDHLVAGFQAGWGMWSEAAQPEFMGPAGRDTTPCPDHAASAALVPCAVLFGLLGASADAPLGRIRLAPRFPSSWGRFEVTSIRVGDASISLRYEREGRRHTFRVRQDGGRIPFMLVFEPEVAEASIEDAFVDGPAADLVRSSARGRSSVRVQLPLAQERVITLVGSGGK